MYDETPRPPMIFGNQVISQFVSHLWGNTLALRPKDYTTLRVAFRKAGGSWEELANGSPGQIEVLKRVVTAWGKEEGRAKKEDDFV